MKNYKSELKEYVGYLDIKEISNMLDFMCESIPDGGCAIEDIEGLEFDGDGATLDLKAISLMHQGGYPLITIDWSTGEVTYISLSAIYGFLDSIDKIHKESKEDTRYNKKYFEMFFNSLITKKYVTYEFFITIYNLLELYGEVFAGASVWDSENGLYRLEEDDPNIKKYYSNHKEDTISSKVLA